MMKEIMSGEEKYDDRSEARLDLELWAIQVDKIKELLDLEASVRDQAQDEPVAVGCKSWLRRLASQTHS